MTAVDTHPLEQAFEHVGHLAEHLTGCELAAADLEDQPLSRDLVQARRLITGIGNRLAQLRRLQKEYDGDGRPDLDGSSAAAPQGG